MIENRRAGASSNLQLSQRHLYLIPTRRTKDYLNASSGSFTKILDTKWEIHALKQMQCFNLEIHQFALHKEARYEINIGQKRANLRLSLQICNFLVKNWSPKTFSEAKKFLPEPFESYVTGTGGVITANQNGIRDACTADTFNH